MGLTPLWQGICTEALDSGLGMKQYNTLGNLTVTF